MESNFQKADNCLLYDVMKDFDGFHLFELNVYVMFECVLGQMMNFFPHNLDFLLKEYKKGRSQ